jgi:hypothetical protein
MLFVIIIIIIIFDRRNVSIFVGIKSVVGCTREPSFDWFIVVVIVVVVGLINVSDDDFVVRSSSYVMIL